MFTKSRLLSRYLFCLCLVTCFSLTLSSMVNNKPENLAKAELKNQITLVLKKSVISPK